MFAVQASVRRLLLLILFFAGCVAPTVSTLGYAIWLKTPHYREACRRDLQSQLGLSVQLDAVTHPLPGVTVLEGIELSDPETGAPLATARVIEAKCVDGDWLLIASQPEIDLDELRQVASLPQLLLRGAGNSKPTYVELWANELTCKQFDNRQTFSDVVGWLQADETAKQAGLRFRLAGTSPEQPAQLELHRNRQQNHTRVLFDTGDVAFPLELVSAASPQWVGRDCRFRGRIDWSRADGSKLTVQGKLVDFDAHALIARHFRHHVAARGTLSLTKAEFREGRLQQASGRWQSPGAECDRDLIENLARNLSLPLQLSPTAGKRLTFAEADLAFRIEQDQIALQGLCPQREGALLAGPGGTLEQTASPQPLMQLVRALVPDSRLLVAASRESDWLLRHLAVPSVIPTSSQGEAPADGGRIRIGGAVALPPEGQRR